MKSTKLLFGITLIAMLGVFTSCDDEDNELGPTLNFFGEEYIDGNKTVNSGETLRWSWQAAKGDNNLESFTVSRDNVDLSGFPKEDIDNDTYRDSLVIDAPMNAGSYVYDFIVTDKAGNTKAKDFIITVEAPNMSTHSDVKVEVVVADGTNASLFSVETGEVYVVNNISPENENLIDFVYGYSDLKAFTNQILSPAETPPEYLNDQSLPNTTNMAIASDVDFDAVDANAIMENISDLSETVISIAEGDVVAFITEGGHKGYLKVKTIYGSEGNSDEYVIFDVKAVLASEMQ
jgi:hypothetical protein